MPKASPVKLNFNAGEFAITVEGRTDLDRYPSSMRKMLNCIAAPQGPCIRRSGTYYMGNAYKHDSFSGLVAFVFSDEQAQMLEFCDERLRFLTEDGFQIYAPVALTSVVTASPFKFTSATLNANIGDEVIVGGFAANLNVNDEVAKITAKSGNDYTVDITYAGATGAQVGKTVARLYHIATPYDHLDVRNIVAVQSVDVLYLFCKGYRTRTLSRFGAYDWRLSTMTFIDGPFEPEETDISALTPASLGFATGKHTSDTAETPSTGSTDSTNAFAGYPAWQAFDNDTTTETYGGVQEYILPYTFDVATIIEGYTIYAPRKNSLSTANNSKDNAPGTWKLEARNGAGAWTVLDERVEYPSYKNLRTQYIKINNQTAYTQYRLNVQACASPGNSFRPGIMQLALRKAGDITIDFTASGTTKINKGAGFKSTDVGRLIRVYQGDGFWRSLEITVVTDSTHITAKLQSEPLYDLSPITRWRMGAVSDTTGWPTVGAFFNDRLAIGGVAEFPTMVALSKVGQYTTFSPTDPDGTVLDDNGMAVRLNSRKASLIRWLVGDSRGLLIGSGDSEWIIRTSANAQPFSARNITADEMSARGSASMQPVKIDKQVIFAQSSRRTVREYAYNYEADGFKSPSLSLFAPHIGVPLFAQMTYSAEPHSIVWFRRDDGTLAGLTYQRDENVIGWHRHDFGGVVESVATIPSIVDNQDTLWMVIRRTINGQTRRYIERLMRFWDFDSTLNTSHFVDCGIRYDGPTSSTLYGLLHLEGKNVCGIADGIPFGMAEVRTVANGSVTLPFMPETYVVLGLQFTTLAETNRIEAGAADGTAQGKTKRIHNLVPFLWQSAKGEVGVYNEQAKEEDYEAIEYDVEGTDIPEAIELFDGMIGPMTMPPGYNTRGSLLFRQTWPLPFNVIALMPQLHTQDR